MDTSQTSFLSAYFIDDINILSVTLDKWGERTEVSTPVKGKVVYEEKMITDVTGQDVLSNAKVLLDNLTINKEDRLQFDGEDHQIIKITRENGFSLNKHKVVYVT